MTVMKIKLGQSQEQNLLIKLIKHPIRKEFPVKEILSQVLTGGGGGDEKCGVLEKCSPEQVPKVLGKDLVL